MRRRVTCMLLLAIVWTGPVSADESVVHSPHDLSVHGPGPIRALHESRICIFCHAPHDAAPQTPLWNRENPQTHYRIYESSTTDARIDQPSGPSKMCLSCHDGSMALGNVLSNTATQPIVMTARTIPPGNSDLTSDLSDDHPIGFHYDRALSNMDSQLRDPEVVTPNLPLGAHGEFHCTTCHDPHNNALGDFLRITDRMSGICVACHDLDGWEHSAHARSPRVVPGRIVDPTEELPYHSIADNACNTCHKVHAARQRERLLRHRREEDNCLNCHDGSIGELNIASQIGKRSGHDVRRRTHVHDPAENPYAMRRHVECVDCHNPHAVQPNRLGPVRGTFGPSAKGPNQNVSGIAITGRQVDHAVYLYEICFKCHADGIDLPRATIARQVTQDNVRLEFQPTNPSFHPVSGPRRNQDVISLIPPLRVGSVISCIDCHNSDESRYAGGTGPNGPHGSLFEPLLIANYDTDDFAIESAERYSLCYRCHSRQSILADQSFPLHRLHIVEQRTPCSVCHDAHGVFRGQGNEDNHSSLINFDLSVVSPAVGRLEFQDTGRISGSCTLTCHNLSHVGFTYGNGSIAAGRVKAARRR